MRHLPANDPSEADFELHRTADPYIGLVGIWFCVSAFSGFVTLTVHDLRGFAVTIGSWIFPLMLILMGRRYRVFWRDGAVVQKAPGKSDVVIAPGEIRRVEVETAGIRDAFTLARPFRRIAIYTDDKTKWIDVSLKHFRAGDVRALMEAIRSKRPDIKIPHR